MLGTLISDLLLSSGLLHPKQVQQAQGVMKQKLCSLEDAVLDLKLISSVALYGAVADQLRIPYVELDDYEPDPKARELISEKAARSHHALPLFRIERSLIVAMADPTDLVAIDTLRQTCGYAIEAYLSSEQEVNRALGRWYGTQGETQQFLEDLVSQPPSAAGAPAKEGEPSVSKLVDLILTQAVRDRASDIHVEPEEDLLRVRFRVDGALREVPPPPKVMESAVVSRLKVLGNLDIAENRIPQDGHFQLKIDERRVDVRISTLPTVHGENVVLRLLDAAEVSIGLERLGFPPEAKRRFEQTILRPYGIILCVGPTGSGKTTTLYSALLRISSVDKNIVTIEDPVEYRLGLIRQVQVNNKAGITFANGLRSILRQDPDVIMVGEIRDRETAEIAIQAALTGHLVFSTLHTNDAASTVTRLLHMGIEPFLVSASVACVVSQRLVRLICESCKTWVDPAPPVVKRWRLNGNPKLARGAGCDRCNQTGYSGRTAVFELMVMDDELREMVLTNPSVVALREASRSKGMQLLTDAALEKALLGLTTIEEVARVSEQWEESSGTEPVVSER